MNTFVTSKDEILKVSRELIREKGVSAINIRSVALKCGISVGSIYNYFNSKSELIEETIESVWYEIFNCSHCLDEFKDIISCITWLYERMEYGYKRYPNFFTLHSVVFMKNDKSDAIKRMKFMWKHILDGLCIVLKNDNNIRYNSFDDEFNEEKFSDFLFSFILSSLMKNDYDTSIILEVIRRTLY